MLWTLAGVGVAALLAGLKPPILARVAGGLVVLGLAVSGGAAWWAPGSTSVSTPPGETRSLLDLSDLWRGHIPADGHLAFIATQPCKPLVEWTFLEENPDRENLEWTDIRAGTRTETTQAIKAALSKSAAETLVTLELAPGSEYFVENFDRPALRAVLTPLLKAQSDFVLVTEHELRGATVRIWQRQPRE